jgi:type VI secretion system Hcp family effector
MTILGQKQGLISNGCSSYSSIGNRYQLEHENQIYVQSLDHDITREQHVNHEEVIITKPIDKSTPLLGVAISENERIIECFLDSYWTSSTGHQEKFFTIELRNASIVKISYHFPNSVTHNDDMPYEVIHLRYESITWKHHTAGTSGYSIWEDRVY